MADEKKFPDYKGLFMSIGALFTVWILVGIVTGSAIAGGALGIGAAWYIIVKRDDD